MSSPQDTAESPLGALAAPPVLAEYLGTTVNALAQMRYEGKGPKFIKLSASKIRYRWSDVAEWLEARSATQTGQVA